MPPEIDVAQYKDSIVSAVRYFWSMRSEQSVTAGRHMDGFSIFFAPS